MKLKWKDDLYDVQTATQIAAIPYSSNTMTAFSLDIIYKRFRTEGFKAFYTFKIVAPVIMD
jgi:hypothetical protein